MEFISAQAITYTEAHSTFSDPLLKKIYDETNAAHPHAHMMSSSLQGGLLSMLCRMLQPRRVLETGTFTGFSALSMAMAMPEDGKLHTIELRDEDADKAAGYFAESAVNEKIILHRGKAADIIPQLQETWDLAFIDADKTGYIDYYELTLPRLRQGGFIIADNVLFHGQVFEENVTGKNAIAINDFNRHVAADPRTEQVLLTVRDGLSIIRKL